MARHLRIFDARPLPAKDPKGIAGKLGEVVVVDADGFTVVCADGRFKVTRVQPDGGKKIDASEFISTAKLAKGALLSSFTPSWPGLSRPSRLVGHRARLSGMPADGRA